MRRNVWIGVIAALAAAAAIALFVVFGPPQPPPSPVASTPPPAPAPPVAAAPQAPANAPSFDAVRIAPDGKAVLAGRATPGADVTVLDRGQIIGHATADANGEWIVLPAQPLAPGARELSLAATTPGASSPTPSTSSLAVVVPDRATDSAAPRPVAVLLPQNGTDAAKAAQLSGAPPPGHIVLDMVEYDASGRVMVSGRADSSATVDIAVNDRGVASATADAGGNWSADVGKFVPVGRYRLRLAASGTPPLTIELRRAAPGELAAGDYLAIVPGNTLWHLAQRSYGDGLRYVELYRANNDKIEDPNRIYPGQLIALPDKS